MPVLAMWQDKTFSCTLQRKAIQSQPLNTTTTYEHFTSNLSPTRTYRYFKDIHPLILSRLEGIAATSELFKHRDLDATLVVHATERKHDDRYHLYWYFTILTLVAILLTIMICSSYPYLFRNLLHKICCTTQPVVNSTTGNKSQSPPEVQPEQHPATSQSQLNGSGKKSKFIIYSVQTVAWSRDFQSIRQPRWEKRVNYYFFLISCSTA